MRFLSYYTDISYSWLFTGSGSMLRDSETSKEKIIDYSSEKIQSPSSDAICLRLMDKLDEKDNVIREKDVQITHIQFELRRQSEELATLKAQITHLQNEKDTARQKFPDVIEDFTSELSGDYGENSSLTRKSTILGMSSEERI